MPRLTRFQSFAVRLMAACYVVLSAGTSSAVADKRTVQAAGDTIGPAIPEPSSILLFLAGLGIVAWGVQNRRSRQ